jgi:hypothetical protein
MQVKPPQAHGLFRAAAGFSIGQSCGIIGDDDTAHSPNGTP